MQPVSRALGRAKALFFKRPDSGRTAPPSGPSVPTPYRPLDASEALLAGARIRRTRGHWPPAELPAAEDDSLTDELVRAYVRPEDERTRRLASPPRRTW
ncbi:hypothetical protein [Streptomyces europaeiscabiei]|uniref:Uncharacterized protein n=1 Tax=Streptomyces europaeiscabiei TaxID=146819 RepID=A0ABU4NSL6_9ACTN|nr:hypothetical protein [Streptomyces europaeiscabiei]MDX3555163.1 hypothetical protein [Streptomyces europaeiscabiei]MDX3705177.1 hypothetical protein [Streptomyces europaeiscabiei]MDX3864412.1 hypothetical protein [Streptomyces europaeiscabiei]MDX3871506.1 hypothetical protein [Streptomyces europaeiscabiei]